MNKIINIYRDAAGNNADALVFLVAFHAYAHMVDDLIDEEFSPEMLMECLAHANAMYSTPFWLANSARLSGIVDCIANTFADSVAWEGEHDWKGRVSDIIRQCGNDMVTQVASIVGGWRHQRAVSLRLREAAYQNQH